MDVLDGRTDGICGNEIEIETTSGRGGFGSGGLKYT